MRITVTGGAGFLGSHLTRRLLALGHTVTVLDDLSTGRAENVPAGARLIQIDIRDPLAAVLAEAQPDVVVHLAAQVSVAASVADPAEALSVNACGTANVMMAAARTGVRKVVAVSSASVYGNPSEVPLTEQSPLAPISPYGVSKLAAEECLRLIGDQHGVAYTIIRPSNIYGAGQAAEADGAVVPAFLNRFLRGEHPVIHGDGSQTRDFVHVSDMVEAVVCALDRADGLTLNVSSGQATTIRALWGMLAHQVGWEHAPVYGPARPGDIQHSVLANGQAVGALGWRSAVPLATGIELTVSGFVRT